VYPITDIFPWTRLQNSTTLMSMDPMKSILKPLPSELCIGLQTGSIIMPPIANCFLELVCGRANIFILSAVHKGELLFHSPQPMISCHRFFPSGEYRWVGSHKTMVPMKLLLCFELIGLHSFLHIHHFPIRSCCILRWASSF
jgi:hypothetical protein